jgi:hypothetical protein
LVLAFAGTTHLFNKLLSIQFSNSQITEGLEIVIAGRTNARPMTGAAKQQSISSRKGGADCFVAEPVIGRAFARPVGSPQ